MNLHPLFIHFPIALLSMYGVMELIRWKKLSDLREWFYVKAAFLWIGGLGALAAYFTGDFGKSIYRDKIAIIRVHESFAKLTLAIFGILALIYLIVAIEEIWGARLREAIPAWNSIARMGKSLFKGWVLVVLASAGLLVLFTTGALGGSIVYGVSSDPFTQFVNNLFVPR